MPTSVEVPRRPLDRSNLHDTFEERRRVGRTLPGTAARWVAESMR
jgi:hypothetical protein